MSVKSVLEGYEVSASAAFLALGLGMPNVLMRKAERPHAKEGQSYSFTKAQMGPYDSPEPAANRPSWPAYIARVNDQLADDRTFLAWLRTGIALFGLGVVIAKFAFIVNPNSAKVEELRFYAAVGIVSVLCGALLVIVGYFQYRRVRHLLTSDAETAFPRWPLASTAGAVGGAVLLSVLLGAST
jgi:uncharacterized membrane protein YidH (DUF202 family)